MSYEQRFELTTRSLLQHIKKIITDNYNGYFDMWLDCESDLQQIYTYEFKEHFGDLITKEISSLLFFAGDNLVFAIKTYVKVNENHSLSDILDYVENFTNIQLENFDNWCDELYNSMYVDEEKEYPMIECHNYSFCNTKDKDFLIEQYGGTCDNCWKYFGHINNINENKECNICNEAKNIIKLQCNHEMCYDCWKKIADDHHNVPTKCPFCRKQIGAWKIPE